LLLVYDGKGADLLFGLAGVGVRPFGFQDAEGAAFSGAGGTIYRAAAKQGQGWRDGNACTTGELRGFLRGAYTGGESLLLARIGRIGVFCEPDRTRTSRAGSATWGRRKSC